MILQLFSHFIPRDIRGNLLFRQNLLKVLREHPELRPAVVEMCRRDINFFINAFVWQYNPNAIDNKDTGGSASVELGPFVTWGFQEEAIFELLDCITKRRDGILEKSREMGASWLCLIVMFWMWLFQPWKQFLLISRNEDAVDDKSPDSLMWKLDFMLKHLPDWLSPKAERSKMYLGNVSNGSTITGQASTGKAGVGGRATAMFIDEFSQIREDREVLDRTSDTTGCRIFNGTHKGTGTAFFDLTNPQSAASGYIKKIQMHWSKHPDKNRGMYFYDREKQAVVPLDPEYNYAPDFEFMIDGTPTGGPYPGIRSPWYDEQCKRKSSSRAVAMDLDIDAKGSIEQVFNVMLIRSLKEACRPPLWEGDIIVEDNVARLYQRQGGPLRLWCKVDERGRPPRGLYAFGCDLSTGSGATNSCVSGANARTGEKVFEYTNPNIEPTPLANLIVPVCRDIFVDIVEGDVISALLCWETPGPGAMFGKRVMDLNYRKVYYRTPDFSTSPNATMTPGWNNQPDPFLALITAYQDALGNRDFVNRSEAALEECRSFRFKPDGYIEHSGVANSKEYSGARVNHGDRVVADALCWKMIRQLNQLLTANAENPAAPLSPKSLAWRKARAAEVEEDAWA